MPTAIALPDPLPLELRLKEARSHLRRARESADAGDRAATIDAARSACKALGEDPFVYYLLASVLLEAGRHREARASIKRAIRLCPTFLDAHFLLGQTYLADGDRLLDRARRAFEVELLVHRCHRGAHLALAKILERRGDARRAAHHRRLSVAFTTRPDAGSAWHVDCARGSRSRGPRSGRIP